jgi:D-xylose transport system substrate-binding protein
VAYDRLAQGPVDYYVAFDAGEVGRVQGQALLEAVRQGGDPKRASIVALNGAPGDAEAAEVKKGAHSVLDGKVTIGKEYDTPEPLAATARKNMQQAIAELSKDKIIGVYAADDTIAGAAIAAMKGQSMSPVPPTTGQDAQLAAVRRVVAGDQYMTVYKPVRPEAEIAAQIAILLAEGRRYTGETAKRNNGTGDVPSVLLKPVAVTLSTVKDTVVKDGLYTVEQICSGDTAAACQEAGLTP